MRNLTKVWKMETGYLQGDKAWFKDPKSFKIGTTIANFQKNEI